MFAPELSPHWIAEQDAATPATPAPSSDNEALSPSQQEALEALVDRVNAARSVF